MEMKWREDAREALSNVPFFVRKRVRRRVEETAREKGVREVTLDHVRECRQRFLRKMEEEVRGYQVETCFGNGGCPNRAADPGDLPQRLQERLEKRDLKAFLKEKVAGPLKMHHEFRIAIADCPNACSRPQIADVGLIGACVPEISGEECSICGACVEVCREKAVTLSGDVPVIDRETCLSCGDCVRSCPTGALLAGRRGYRLLVGGKLGRHPRLGAELPGLFEGEGIVEGVELVLDHYQRHCAGGERFGEVLERTGTNWLISRREVSDVQAAGQMGTAEKTGAS